MNNEERFLVLKDLSGRLTTDVKVVIADNPTKILHLNGGMIDLMWEGKVEYKPYLRPMSSMTEEEKKEYNQFVKGIHGLDGRVTPLNFCEERDLCKCFDWLNAHHFDYRGLIEKGLAIEAPEDMYKNK